MRIIHYLGLTVLLTAGIGSLLLAQPQRGGDKLQDFMQAKLKHSHAILGASRAPNDWAVNR
jgi:hypothetical protein